MKKSLIVLAAALLILLLMYARSLYEARRHLFAGMSAIGAQRVQEAGTEFRQAITWSSPGNIFARDAVAALRTMAFDNSNPEDVRLHALRELIRGLRASRNILNPSAYGDGGSVVHEAQTEIDRLSHSDASAQAIHAEKLPEPRFSLQLAAQLMFYCWLGSIVWAIFRGFKPDGSLQRRELLQGLGVSAAFFLGWLLALSAA